MKRKQREDELISYRDHLEDLIKERTVELTSANDQLLKEIEERKYTEKLLRESEEKYRELFETVPVGIFQSTFDNKLITINPEVAKIAGCQSIEEAMSYYTDIAAQWFAVPGEREKFLAKLKAYGELVSHEYRARRKDGVEIWIKGSARINRKQNLIEGFFVDITEQKQMDSELKASEERFRNLAELLPGTVYETDLAGNLTFINKSALDQFGYDPDDFIKGLSIFNIIDPSDHETLKRDMLKVFAGENIRLSEYTARKKDGTTFPTISHTNQIIHDGKTVGLRGILLDIKEKKDLEENLVRAQKMEAIGTLAGGIAHDFNNLLMGVLGNVSLLLINLDNNSPLYKRLKNIEEYINRGSDLTKQLLGYARGGKYEVKPADLGEFVRRSSEMFGRTKKEVRIHRKAHEEGLWTVELDHGQMEQVLLNLYVNAWQAMP